MPSSSLSWCLLTKSKQETNFSFISQCGFNQNPFLSQITSTLTNELERSFPIRLDILLYVFLDCNSCINLVNPGNCFELSFVTKHLNFKALPPSEIPSLNTPSPPSIALVPS